jgi:hypothetical protein
MNKKIVVISLAAACLVLVLAFILGSRDQSAAPVLTEAKKEDHTKVGEMKPAYTPPPDPKKLVFQVEEANSLQDFSSNPPRTAEENTVIAVIAKTAPDEEKANELLALASTVKDEDAKELAIEHAAKFIPDDDYLAYRERLFQLAQNAEIRELVMDDALMRSEEYRLPTLVEMLGTTLSDKENTEIREILEAYLDKDYGPSPSAWKGPVDAWVKENSQ